MKYLKKIEIIIKHTDPISINNVLRDFSKRLEDIVIAFQNFENDTTIKTYVRRYFHDDGRIAIYYKINLIYKNDNKFQNIRNI